MAEELLGVGFEIHGGGNDLAFPHHENEAAQTRMGRGAELAQIWMHNGMLQLKGMTMGKSLGNAIRLHEVIAEVGRDALIMLFANAHYRQPMLFDDERLTAAGAQVTRIRDAARRLVDGPSPDDMRPHRDAFFAALADDFNTAQALGALFEWVREANRRDEPVGRDDLVEMLEVLGLENLVELGDAAGPEDLALLERRQAARASKDWAQADRLRDELAARGWTVRDGAGRRRARAARRVILYGRNAVHEALRAKRRRIGPVWATERAAREPWLRGVLDVQVVSAGEIERRCESPDHQGICADAGGYPYVGAAELLARQDPVHRRARRAAGSAEPRGDLSHRRGRGRYAAS